MLKTITQFDAISLQPNSGASVKKNKKIYKKNFSM